MTGLPVYCARGRTQHLAAWLVTAPGRQEVVCDEHLAASREWAGPKARAEPVEQPPSGQQQQTLF
jgi:hypothetical protein